MLSFTIDCRSLGSSPTLVVNRLLSIALIWSIIISDSLLRFAVPFLRCTLKISLSGDTFVVIGQIIDEGWSFSRLVWTIRTGRTLPVSVPRCGSRSAIQMDKTDHQTTCHRFWLTTLYYYQSIKWDGQAVPAQAGQCGRFFHIIPVIEK